MDGEYFVKDFLEHLITKRRDEFGSVTIKTEAKDKPKLIFKKDETQNLFGFENYLDKKIKSITANGGWWQMHYSLTLDSDGTEGEEKMNLFTKDENHLVVEDSVSVIKQK